MMLARVADSLYWIGRYIERAEHVSRLAAVMLNATLDRTQGAVQTGRIGLAALGEPDDGRANQSYDAAHDLALDRADSGSVVISLAQARENARQVRDQISTETWERLNLLYLRTTGPGVEAAFEDDPVGFLNEIIADLHLFKGAADTTLSHGEGWRFLLLGVHIERAQLSARLLEVCFGAGQAPEVTEPIALMSVLRMACALEPYLRVYTADINPRFILEFLLFDEDFPRSIRFCTARIEDLLAQLSRHAGAGRGDAQRLAGRLDARLKYADIEEVEATGAGALLAAVGAECAAIHEATYETFVAYPLELSLHA
ncbi:MAG TPA: alpha-E domain-containing protein [Caulobacteraceae bacterium]|nr:alpha-E domain-containing protein [Caulobacteraceae bacterium]